jgi:cytidylate kinase
MAVLTISREFGSGGREIGNAVADALGYAVVGKERMLEDIRTMGHKWEQWSKELDEHSPSLWEKYDWSFRGFVALMQSVVLNYALQDRVVLLGRGGNFLLKDIPYALRVRITAPLASRIERIMTRESVDQDTARWLIEKTDRERSGFIHTIYGRNWDDPSEYDTVLSTGLKPLDEIAQTLTGLLVERDRFCSEECRNTVKMRGEAARIKAGLLTDPQLFIPTLDVNFDGTNIVLRGIIHNPKEYKRVENAAHKLAGNLPFRCALHYRG